MISGNGIIMFMNGFVINPIILAFKLADSAVLHFCKKCYTLGQHFKGYTSGLPFFGEVQANASPKSVALWSASARKACPNSATL